MVCKTFYKLSYCIEIEIEMKWIIRNAEWWKLKFVFLKRLFIVRAWAGLTGFGLKMYNIEHDKCEMSTNVDVFYDIKVLC